MCWAAVPNGLPHEAVLVIGDAALLLSARQLYPVRVDLGAEWSTWTGLPFVFAVWAARKDYLARDFFGHVDFSSSVKSRQLSLGA